tara:strand:- start:149 stop:403 length:255 start_codon:yes stop_codon:yes gene_type:complete
MSRSNDRYKKLDDETIVLSDNKVKINGKILSMPRELGVTASEAVSQFNSMNKGRDIVWESPEGSILDKNPHLKEIARAKGKSAE